MEVNQEAIHGTRPWKVFGEGPQMASAAPIRAQGFNEGRGKSFTAEDVRYTTKGNTLYAIIMGAPTGAVSIKSLGKNAKLLEEPISEVTLLGSDEKLKWSQTDDALVIEAQQYKGSDIAIVFKIMPKG
jgi:alpha-L-fucosidase